MSTKSTKASLLLTAAALSLGLSAATAAPAVTLFSDGTTLTALSGDGSTIGGSDASGAFRLVAGARIPLAVKQISGISDDGSVITGYLLSGSESQAFRWTQANGIQTLRAPSGVVLPGITLPRTANGLAIAGNGGTIVGTYSTANSTSSAFTWANGVSTTVGGLSGLSSTSSLRGVSANGNVIVGISQSTPGQQGYARIGNGSLIALGNFTSSPALAADTYYSAATAVSRDGLTIIGTGNMNTKLSSDTTTLPHSFGATWKITGSTVGTITQLPVITLPDATITYQGATASFCNSDASVIVGAMNQRKSIATPNGVVSQDSTSAVIWSGTAYHHRIVDLLVSAGVTGLNDSQFRNVTGISADSDIIIGTGDAGSWIVTGARTLVGLSSLEVILPKVSVQAGSSNPVISYDTVGGQSYQVERSTDLLEWSSLGSPFSTAGQSGAGSNSVTDSTAPIGARAFYRVTVQRAQ